jgi:hypothetical protein
LRMSLTLSFIFPKMKDVLYEIISLKHKCRI